MTKGYQKLIKCIMKNRNKSKYPQLMLKWGWIESYSLMFRDMEVEALVFIGATSCTPKETLGSLWRRPWTSGFHHRVLAGSFIVNQRSDHWFFDWVWFEPERRWFRGDWSDVRLPGRSRWGLRFFCFFNGFQLAQKELWVFSEMSKI